MLEGNEDPKGASSSNPENEKKSFQVVIAALSIVFLKPGAANSKKGKAQRETAAPFVLLVPMLNR